MKRRLGEMIVWPSYLDQNLTRSEGRRIAAKLAVPSPTADLLKEAADTIGLEARVEGDKAYPRTWFSGRGRLVITNPRGHKKNRVILMLAKAARQIVASRVSENKAQEKRAGRNRGARRR
ncbi:MAG: signal recognition particle subunit SRP19/SEC65 family protein [Candidatus Thorarchaeota archaeon]